MEDVMQCKISDSVTPRTIYIAPGAILSTAEFYQYQPLTTKFEPVALRRLGMGKVAQSRCARFGCASMGLKVKVH